MTPLEVGTYLKYYYKSPKVDESTEGDVAGFLRLKEEDVVPRETLQPNVVS